MAYRLQSSVNMTFSLQAGREKFAFIYESPYLEYKQQLSCDNVTDLMNVGEEFSKFGYLILRLKHILSPN